MDFSQDWAAAVDRLRTWSADAGLVDAAGAADGWMGRVIDGLHAMPGAPVGLGLVGAGLIAAALLLRRARLARGRRGRNATRVAPVLGRRAGETSRPVVAGFAEALRRVRDGDFPADDRTAAHRALAGLDTLEEADGQISRAVADLAAVKATRPDMAAVVDRALADWSQGRIDGAVAVFLDGFESRGGGKEVLPVTVCARHLGALAFLAEATRAVGYYRRTVELEPTTADGWGCLGMALLEAGDPDGAEAACQRAAILGSATRNGGILAAASATMARARMAKGDLDRAEAHARIALMHCGARGAAAGMARQHAILAEIALDRNDHAAAETYFRKALALDTAAGRLEGIAGSYGGLALAAEEEGDAGRARAHWLTARDLYDAAGRGALARRIEALAGRTGSAG